MIKIVINNNLEEARSKTRYLDEVSRDIKNFIIDQLTSFPDTYFKKSDIHEFKITDLPSVKNNSELSNLQNLKLKIVKKEQDEDLNIPKAIYHPPDIYIAIVMHFKKNITNLNDIDKKYFKYLHETIAKMAYHELVHHLQFKYYREDFSSDRGAFSTVTTPINTYIADTSGATEKEIKDYRYYSSPDEIEAYVRDTYYSSRKKRIPFSKSLANRIRHEKEKTFTSLRGKYLYHVIIYNMLKYAIERYPSVNDEKNNQTLEKYKQFLDKNKEIGMEKQITTESLTSNFKNWMKEDVITESSVGQLMASHGVPKTFAKHVKSKCSNGNSDFILKVFMKNYKNMIESITSEAATEKDKMLSDNYIMEFDRFMGHAGKTLDEYLKKHRGKKHRQEILELCEAGWPKFLKKMRDYKKSLDESLNEVRLNKTWKKRIKQRAKRNERDVSSEDKKWAKNRLKELNKKYPELEEAYLNEIEAAMEAAKASNVYLEKLRALRKKKLDDAKALVKPTPDELSKREKPGHRPTALEREPNQKIKGKQFAAAGETIGPGPLEELEIQEENTNE